MRSNGPSSDASPSVRSAALVTWRRGFTISVPKPNGPTQCSTSQDASVLRLIDDDFAVDHHVLDANRELFGVAFGRRCADAIRMKDDDVCFHSIAQ